MPKHYRTKVCQEKTCGVKFTTSSHLAKYCPTCRLDVTREQVHDARMNRYQNLYPTQLFSTRDELTVTRKGMIRKYRENVLKERG